DKVPMTYKHYFEDVDRTFKDILQFHNNDNLNLPFGGKVVVLEGGFRQILSVIPKGTRQEILTTLISQYWIIRIIHLFFQNNTILAPENGIFDMLNDYILSYIPRKAKIYLSFDITCSCNANIDRPDGVHTLEFLNTTNSLGFPKIIATRLKKFMPIMLAPHQCSFMPGRYVIDNVVIAQEIFHSMHRKKGKSSFMAIKMDLKKAYDRLRWDFLIDTSKEVLFNRVPSDESSSSRGVRQGDPISLYLFKSIKLCRTESSILYLFFPNDLLLFGDVSISQMDIINKCLDVIFSSSGQKVANSLSFVSRCTLAKTIVVSLSTYTMHNRVGTDYKSNGCMHFQVSMNVLTNLFSQCIVLIMDLMFGEEQDGLLEMGDCWLPSRVIIMDVVGKNPPNNEVEFCVRDYVSVDGQ
ncbi:hypothetical protein CR513_10187, partial [Mucuna pruriens]